MSSKAKKTVKVVETEAVVEPVKEEPATETVAEVAQPAKTTVIYIGPSIPNVVQASTIFKDGVLSATMQKCVEEKPYIKKLLVPMKELPAAMKELRGESAISNIYRKVKSEN